MEMQQVRYFLALSQTLNFTRAAEECNITQPAFTRAIKALEEELGGELIRREGKLSHLTDLGHRMLPLLRQCYDSAITAKALASSLKVGAAATLMLGISSSVDLSMLVPALMEMFRHFPGLQLKLRRGKSEEIAELLKSGEVDLAICDELHGWERLERWPMLTESYDLVVGVDHPLTRRNAEKLDLQVVRRERFLVHRDCELQPDQLDRSGISFDTAHKIDCVRDLEAMLAAHFGVAILPESSMRTGRTRHIALTELGLRRTIALHGVVGRPRGREAGALLNLVRATDWCSVLAKVSSYEPGGRDQVV